MKKFIISTMVVLVSVSSFAQSAMAVDTSKALEALFRAAPTTAMVGNVDKNMTLEQMLAPLKNDLSNFIATGMTLGDDGDLKPELSMASMSCKPMGSPYGTCELQMNRAQTNEGTTITFQVVIAKDGSMALSSNVVDVESDK